MQGGEYKVEPLDGGKLSVTFKLKKGGRDSEINIVLENSNQSYALFALLAEGYYENVTEIEQVNLESSLLHLNISEMRQLMADLNKYGAADSEPWWHFRRVLESLHYLDIPESAEKWELYTATMNCTHAGDLLTKKTQQIYDVLRKTTKTEVIAVYKYWGFSLERINEFFDK
jgi:hypothetical protein